MNETTRKTIKAAVITAALSATVFVPVGLAGAGTPQASGEPSPIAKSSNTSKAAIKGIFAPAKTATADQVSARPEGMNMDMIYMPAKGNGVCDSEQGKRNSCMVEVVVNYADGIARKAFGVYVGHDLIATDYELVTGHGDSYAVKPGDGHAYTIALSDGTTRKALPWAFVPGSIAVLRMQ